MTEPRRPVALTRRKLSGHAKETFCSGLVADVATAITSARSQLQRLRTRFASARFVLPSFFRASSRPTGLRNANAGRRDRASRKDPR